MSQQVLIGSTWWILDIGYWDGKVAEMGYVLVKHTTDP